MDIKWISLIITIFLAFIGYFITYINNLRLAKRKDHLDLVNKQLNEFYGPLFISSEAGRIAIEALQTKLGGYIFSRREVPKPDNKRYREWRIWVEQVFKPLNDFRDQIILNNAHLIREQEVPPCLLSFVAHVSAYKAVIKKWSEGDYSEHLSIIDFPSELLNYAKDSYYKLKQEQIKLIGNQ